MFGPRPIFRSFLALLICIGAFRGGLANEPWEIVSLKSGDRLTGVSRGFRDGFLCWEMPYGEQIQIPLHAIESIEYPAWEHTESEEDDLFVIGEEGEFDEPPNDDEELPETALDEAPTILQAPLSPFEEGYGLAWDGLSSWTKRLEFGGRFLSGNTRTDTIDVAAKFDRQHDFVSSQIDLGGQYGRANRQPNTNRWFGNGTVDFTKTEQWIFFVTTRHEYDRFENLDWRGMLSTGLGYRFINEELRRLIVRAGPGVTHERFRSPSNARTTPDMFVEVESQTPLFERMQVEQKSTIHPSLKNFNVFRLINTAGLLVKLDNSDQWRLKVGFRHEYNSRPNPGRVRNDLMTSILLVYTRK